MASDYAPICEAQRVPMRFPARSLIASHSLRACRTQHKMGISVDFFSLPSLLTRPIALPRSKSAKPLSAEGRCRPQSSERPRPGWSKHLRPNGDGRQKQAKRNQCSNLSDDNANHPCLLPRTNPPWAHRGHRTPIDTLNQRVQGSSPCAPTNIVRYLTYSFLLVRSFRVAGVAIRVTAGMAFSQPILIAAERTGALCCVRALFGCGLEVQSKVSGEVILINRRIRPPLRPGEVGSSKAAHNGLVGGSNPSSPTTQSYANGDFPAFSE